MAAGLRPSITQRAIVVLIRRDKAKGNHRNPEYNQFIVVSWGLFP